MNSDRDMLREAFRWDVVNWSRALELWEPVLAQPGPLRVLEVGGREGGLSSLAAYYGHQVVCSDLENPESIAAPLHRAQGLTERITYEAIDATDIPHRDVFDVILFKSILGGIGRDNHPEKQQQAIQSMHRALKPGGYLLFAENLRGSAMHRQLRATFQPWGKSWRYLTPAEMEQLLSPFSKKELRTTGLLGTLGRNESQRNMLGKIDQSFSARICPSSWHYIIYGYARK